MRGPLSLRAAFATHEQQKIPTTTWALTLQYEKLLELLELLEKALLCRLGPTGDEPPTEAHHLYPGKGIFLWFEGFSLKLFQI